MSLCEHIKESVAVLLSSSSSRFGVWFDEYAARRFDGIVAKDISRGKLERFADAALIDVRRRNAITTTLNAEISRPLTAN